jgi:MoaA/NifB/PqqE/SkfB family radical SAM enzyme
MREVMLETNGRRVAYPPYAEALVASGPTMLCVTVHGPDAALHDRITRVPGSFEQTLAGARNLQKMGLQNVAVNLPLHRHYLGDGVLKQAVAKFLELGMRRFMLQYLTPFGAYRGKLGPLPAYADILPVVRALIDDTPEAETKVMNLPFCLLEGYEAHVHPDVNNIGELPVTETQTRAISSLVAHGRQKDARCESCEYAFLCSGALPMPSRPTEG